MVLVAIGVGIAALGAGRVSSHASAKAASGRAETVVIAPSASVDPALVAAVADEVDRRNREARRDREAFENAGWTLVDTQPPEQALLDVDPALLDGREPELRTQLLSTTAPPERAPRVLTIAERAHDPATRVAAVEALGRMASEGQIALVQLLMRSRLDATDPAYGVAATLIRPPIDDAALTHDIEQLAQAASLAPNVRQQLSSTLSVAHRIAESRAQGAAR